jgi:transposase InsO family protein
MCSLVAFWGVFGSRGVTESSMSSPYTPQYNGVVERKNKMLIDMASTMLEEYKTLDQFWVEVVNTACEAIN